ncbi:MAG: hypothetical protein E7L40_07330 [Corynebacterium kroppenstedtii]|nr:hypothetical protein [Corynebacterium kroppenstedtii]
MPSRSDNPPSVGDSHSARPNREGIKERAPLDGRLLPCAAGVWAASGVVVWFRWGTSEAASFHGEGDFIGWWFGHPVSAVAVCAALTAATVITARCYVNRRRGSYGMGFASGARRSWVLQLLMMVVGAIIGGVRSVYAIRRSVSPQAGRPPAHRPIHGLHSYVLPTSAPGGSLRAGAGAVWRIGIPQGNAVGYFRLRRG